MDLLETFGLQQHINVETHQNGHTLDLVITRREDDLITNSRVSDPVISDHFAVHCGISMRKPCFPRKVISYRKVKSVERDRFNNDIKNSPLMGYENIEDITDLVDLYENTLTSLLELHAPLKRRVVTLRPAAPWYSDQIRAEKVKRRRLERHWRANRLTVTRELYVNQCNLVNRLIHESKMKFYSAVIDENRSNQAALFTTVDKMLNSKVLNKLPSYDSALDLANRFADFFVSKVQAIRNSFPSPSTVDEDQSTVCSSDHELHVFTPTTVKELSTLIGSTTAKSCMLDPVPGSILKDCSNVLLPVITRIVNLSFAEAVVPEKFKEAILTHKIKKPSLDNELLPSYRPISNLRFTSKVTEKVAASRLNSHLNDNNLHKLFQSAYKQGYSTETALIRVQNDILSAIDNNGCVILLLLDLSAAFDTVDHHILLTRLSCRFGIKGNALKWIKSYLSDRRQSVCVDNERSSSQDLSCGVPQGSVLGPILYLLYTAPLGKYVLSFLRR